MLTRQGVIDYSRDMANNRRTQKPKPVRNIDWMRAEQERRRSSVAQPHKSKKAYNRKPKHKEW